jgi:hypothetical protein
MRANCGFKKSLKIEHEKAKKTWRTLCSNAGVTWVPCVMTVVTVMLRVVLLMMLMVTLEVCI